MDIGIQFESMNWTHLNVVFRFLENGLLNNASKTGSFICLSCFKNLHMVKKNFMIKY